MSVLTSMYDPRAPSLVAVEEGRKTLCNEEELHDMRGDAKKKAEHTYRVMSPVQLNQAVTPFSLFELKIFSGSITRNLSSL